MIGYMVRDANGQLCLIDVTGTEPFLSRLVNGKFMRLQRLDRHEMRFYDQRRISQGETKVICARMRLELTSPKEEVVEKPARKRGRPRKDEVEVEQEPEQDAAPEDMEEPPEPEESTSEEPADEPKTPGELVRKVRKYTRRKKVE